MVDDYDELLNQTESLQLSNEQLQLDSEYLRLQLSNLTARNDELREQLINSQDMIGRQHEEIGSLLRDKDRLETTVNRLQRLTPTVAGLTARAPERSAYAESKVLQELDRQQELALRSEVLGNVYERTPSDGVRERPPLDSYLIGSKRPQHEYKYQPRGIIARDSSQFSYQPRSVTARLDSEPDSTEMLTTRSSTASTASELEFEPSSDEELLAGSKMADID